VITTDRLRSIALWSQDLTENEREHARHGIVEKAFAKGAYICHRGDRLDSWIGVVSGIIKLSTLSVSGKAVTLAGVRSSGWFGEGTVLKNEIRQYDLVLSRQVANKSLKLLEKKGLLRLEHGGLTVLDIGRLLRFGE
jgi:CRP/FNR family transcriptional regulator, cyclic AMP receptor protein